MIKIDWDTFFGEHVIFGWYRLMIITSLDPVEYRYSWGTYPFDLHKPKPWHWCFKI